MRTTRPLVPALALVAAAIAAAPASGSGWTALPAPANPVPRMGTPAVAAAPDGSLTAAWSGHDGSSFPVVAVSRDPRTGWGEPTVLRSASSMVSTPAVAVDPSGRAVVAWTRCESSTWRVEAAERPPGGPWGGPVTLATSPCLRTDTRAFATVDDAGRVVLAWTSSDPFLLSSAASPPAGGWTAPVQLAPAAVGPDVGLAATDDGGVLAAWTLEGGTGAVQVAQRDAGGAWGAPATLTSGSASRTSASLALAGGRRAVVAWREGGWSDARAWAVARDGDGAWGTPAPVSGAAAGVWGVSAAADPEGRAVVAWVAGSAPGAATGTTAGLGPAATPGADGRSVWSVAAGLDPGGAPLIAWSDNQRAGVTAHDGAWGSGSPLAPADAAAGTPVVGRVAGATLVARAQGSSSSFGLVEGAALRVSVLDARPPALRIAPPGPATAGARVTLSAAAEDAWSPVGEVAWTLGDGAVAIGAEVGHVYADPGTYAVTARVEDAVGNVATTGFDLIVAAPPAPPPAATSPPPAPGSAPGPPTRRRVPPHRLLGPASLPVRRGVVTIPVACAGARCAARVELTAGGRTLAVGRIDARPGGRASAALRLSAGARRRVARVPRLRATVLVRVRDAGVWRVAARRAVVLRAPR